MSLIRCFFESGILSFVLTNDRTLGLSTLITLSGTFPLIALLALFHLTYSDGGLSGMPGFSLGVTETDKMNMAATVPAPAGGET